MRFAAILSFLAVCPGLGSRIGSQPPKNDHHWSLSSFGFHSMTTVKLINLNRGRCNKCVDFADKHVDHWLFYSWKIDEDEKTGEKRLIAQCELKEPEENEGFTTSSAMDKLDKLYCDESASLDIPDGKASGVKGITHETLKFSDRHDDFLPACEKCAAKFVSKEVFFWKAEGEESERKISTTCDIDAPQTKGWERNPPPRSGEHFKITKEWCMNAFGEPTNGRGLHFWLKLFGVLVVVVAAAAGVYLGIRGKADEDESTN